MSSPAIARQVIEEPLKALNAVCPYFTMFPLEFPLRVLHGRARSGDIVVDPFCGRGTTNYAARLLGLRSLGVDSSPVAVALTQAKLANARASDVMRAATSIVHAVPPRVSVPRGEFWERAYDPAVLRTLCWLRKELLRDCSSDARVLLRAIILGALHGPRNVSSLSYFSNQSPRTYAPKPDYAAGYWRRNRMKPPKVDVLALIRTRATRYLGARPAPTESSVVLGDSREPSTFGTRRFQWIITSPPYYGMRTYVPDQWLRNWFLGGPARVDYAPASENLSHASPDRFAADLRKVWLAVAIRAGAGARLVVRFGGIADRDVDPVDLLKQSLRESGWRLTTIVSAGDAHGGRRQATQFRHGGPAPREENDFHAVLD